jgi:hypothetical protein
MEVNDVIFYFLFIKTRKNAWLIAHRFPTNIGNFLRFPTAFRFL